ncbi:MAG: sugar phosphate nucleotidyltransferase [bacterium]
MEVENNRWAIVLAAGEGSRLRCLTTDASGTAVPKQYCSFQRPHSMLRDALLRAERLIPKERIVTIVAAGHERWWQPELVDIPRENILVQPQNRGTAAGVLLPLMEILRRDPDAEVLVLPSDHFIEDEAVLERAFRAALPAAHEVFRRVVLLGIMPDLADAQYGWIVPRAPGKEKVYGVESFVEKPDQAVANRLFRQGGLWNSFMFAASGKTLLYLFQEILPQLLEPFVGRLFDASRFWDPVHLAEIYEQLPTLDFSRHLLERVPASLGVLPVPPCGWSDLGTPERIQRCLVRSGENWDVELYSKQAGRPILLPQSA